MVHRKLTKVFNMAGARKIVRLVKSGRACSQGDMKACIGLLDTALKTATGKNRILKTAVERAESLVERLLPR